VHRHAGDASGMGDSNATGHRTILEAGQGTPREGAILADGAVLCGGAASQWRS
jgi:hypothetical protein